VGARLGATGSDTAILGKEKFGALGFKEALEFAGLGMETAVDTPTRDESDGAAGRGSLTEIMPASATAIQFVAQEGVADSLHVVHADSTLTVLFFRKQ